MRVRSGSTSRRGGLRTPIAAYDVDLDEMPPRLAPAGRLPTLRWLLWACSSSNDGSLVVGGAPLWPRRRPSRTAAEQFDLLRGGVQRIPAPTAGDLEAGDAAVARNVAVAAQDGYAEVSCPEGGGPSDFPIPATNTGKPSPVIDRVFVVVRENKTFEGIFGDFAGVKGDPTNTLLPATQMDGIWTNIRKIARTFALTDNFYTSAFISEPGHVWTTFGRTNDFTEREWWVTGYGRELRSAADFGGSRPRRAARGGGRSSSGWTGTGSPTTCSASYAGDPARSSGRATTLTDPDYPGGNALSVAHPDVEKGCYVAGRARVLCDLGKVVYMTLPNDHTNGLSPGTPTPETMFAVNDEATGMLVDAISHSPLWQRSLVIVVEDDPSAGAASRSTTTAPSRSWSSPWIRARLHLLTRTSRSPLDPQAHRPRLRPRPTPNVEVAERRALLDLFTVDARTTPLTRYARRTHPAAQAPAATPAEARLTGVLGERGSGRAAGARRAGDALDPRPTAHRADPGDGGGHRAARGGARRGVR